MLKKSSQSWHVVYHFNFNQSWWRILSVIRTPSTLVICPIILIIVLYYCIPYGLCYVFVVYFNFLISLYIFFSDFVHVFKPSFDYNTTHITISSKKNEHYAVVYANVIPLTQEIVVWACLLQLHQSQIWVLSKILH